MAEQQVQQAQTFQVPTPGICGFYYGIRRLERLEIRLPPVFNVDLNIIEPNIGNFGNGRPVHKGIVAAGGREFLMYAWRVRRNQGVERNLLLADIRESTNFYGEVLVFAMGATAQVPFLKSPGKIAKKLTEDAVGCFVTGLLDAIDAGRIPPPRYKLTM